MSDLVLGIIIFAIACYVFHLFGKKSFWITVGLVVVIISCIAIPAMGAALAILFVIAVLGKASKERKAKVQTPASRPLNPFETHHL